MPGKRYSKQRDLIYQAVRESREHPTAEMVYQRLKADNPNLSLGTVYRNLNLLSREGALRRMPFPVERYDGDVSPHSHLCCERCGGVSDLEVGYDDALDALAQKAQAGAEVRRHELLFYGLCARCAAGGEDKMV